MKAGVVIVGVRCAIESGFVVGSTVAVAAGAAAAGVVAAATLDAFESVFIATRLRLHFY